MRFILWLSILFYVLLLSCSQGEAGNPRIVIVTEAGEIEVELFEKQAPKTVAAFLENVHKGYYERASFYRVLTMDNQPSNSNKTQLVQGGVWRKKNKPADARPVPHEPTSITGISHKNGTISMARHEPGTASTEFFICLEDQPGLDYGGANNPDGQGYAAFGRVVKGMDVVRRIYSKPDYNQYFDKLVAIMNIERK